MNEPTPTVFEDKEIPGRCSSVDETPIPPKPHTVVIPPSQRGEDAKIADETTTKKKRGSSGKEKDSSK